MCSLPTHILFRIVYDIGLTTYVIMVWQSPHSVSSGTGVEGSCFLKRQMWVQVPERGLSLRLALWWLQIKGTAVAPALQSSEASCPLPPPGRSWLALGFLPLQPPVLSSHCLTLSAADTCPYPWPCATSAACLPGQVPSRVAAGEGFATSQFRGVPSELS